MSPLVCESLEHASVSRFLFVSPTLSDRTCGNSVDCKFRSTNASFWTFTTELSDHIGGKPLALCSEDSLTVPVFTANIPTISADHIGGKPLALCSEDSLTVFVFTAFVPAGSDATERTVFVVSAKGTHIRSYEAISLGSVQSLQQVS